MPPSFPPRALQEERLRGQKRESSERDPMSITSREPFQMIVGIPKKGNPNTVACLSYSSRDAGSASPFVENKYFVSEAIAQDTQKRESDFRQKVQPYVRFSFRNFSYPKKYIRRIESSNERETSALQWRMISENSFSVKPDHLQNSNEAHMKPSRSQNSERFPRLPAARLPRVRRQE